MKHQVRANATADLITRLPAPLWRVEVTGEPPHPYFRVYFLGGAKEEHAAFEGLRMFVRDVERFKRSN